MRATPPWIVGAARGAAGGGVTELVAARAGFLFLILGALGVGSCGGGAASSSLSTPTPGAGGCADIFSDDQVTTYEIQISQSEWDGLVSDFYNMAQNDAANRDIHTSHVLEALTYGNEG